MAKPQLDALAIVPQNMRWGFAIDEFQVEELELRSGDILGDILLKRGLTYPQIQQLVDQSKGVFNITSFRMGKNLNFLTRGDEAIPQFMIYEPSPYEYILFNLREPFTVEVVKRDVQTEIVAASGVLETNFWQALVDNDLSDELADGMIDLLASSVDFYHQKVGDRFKVVFEQHYVEGKAVGTGKILAAVYERDEKESFAFNFEKEGEKTNYYDFEGRPARKAFLKSPVKFSRISSRYNLNRKHPILGYRRAHRGTDYAAPTGTPIMAVAEGTVTEACRRGGNGIYVKIRHDGTYSTQYLHMSRYAKGIRPGVRVAQGQTIGYVGSTGLSTGPHCCFRFWKNGVEVDHLRLNLPQPKPISGELLEEFKVARDELLKLLNSVPYRTHEEIAQGPQGLSKIHTEP
ncbi:MAG: peptidoglycan DD-metalloendopeptidase family protein [Saprospiraceae bacterium]|nr:peptidoglycan DD-metalloendopeptidase family protein [Saprospiraceae bacterium]MCB9343169.1 peptidoglycan DD-metalloendopeptidase family protein [Lewinellaceae bacterium]